MATAPNSLRLRRVTRVISDLHLFCTRSNADEHMGAIFDAAREAEVFILNGDIVDFRWSNVGGAYATARAAVSWLDELVRTNPACEFHYILGNHDSVPEHIEALTRFSNQARNFSWCPYFVRMGDALFLHGDVAHRNMDSHDLARARRRATAHRRKGEVLNKVYDKAFEFGVHKAILKAASPTEAVVRRLRHYIDSIDHGPATGTRRIYFGHTHVAVDGHHDRGLTYYNCGAPLTGLKFNILETDVYSC